jgi:hypothetical protein
MILLGDEAQVETCLSPFEDSGNLISVRLETVLVSVQFRARFVQTYNRLRNHLGRTRRYSYVTRLKWKLVYVRLEIVVISMQEGCAVCVECTVGSKSSWTHSMELLDEWVMWESCFRPFGGFVSVCAIWVHGLRRTYNRLRNNFGCTR